MIELRVLGGADLRGVDPEKATGVLTQSKVLAGLVFLAVAEPRGFHRRDRLTGLLWPELDQAHARAALRKVVLALRSALGESAIAARGDEELAINADDVWCDAREFPDAVKAERYARALDLYRGDLLPGFFLPAAGEFEDWLGLTRTNLRDRASAAAFGLANIHKGNAEFTVAGRYAKQAAALAPTDERTLQKVLKLLGLELGNVAAALYLYEDFAKRLKRDFDAEPSAETKRLIGDIRRSR